MNRYEDLFEKQDTALVTFMGVSMMPMLREGIDTVVLKKVDASNINEIKKYDVVLYRRPKTQALVMHRIIKAKKSSFNICGDNLVRVEKNVDKSWIIAVMTGFYRDEEYIDVTNTEYIKYYKKRVKNRKYRLLKYICKKVFRKK